jgi:predicted DNA-binding transcriptional regulator AlpA
MKKVVFSDMQLDEVQDLSASLSIQQIADYFGISKTTFYEVVKRQPELLERYKQGRARRIGQYAALVHQYILEGDKDMLKFYLRMQAGWNEKDEPQDTQELPPINIILST